MSGLLIGSRLGQHFNAKKKDCGVLGAMSILIMDVMIAFLFYFLWRCKFPRSAVLVHGVYTRPKQVSLGLGNSPSLA